MEPASGGADDQSKCAVCRGSFQDPSRPSSCRHVFCKSCLRQSLRSRPHCPLCREPCSQLILPALDVPAHTGAPAVSATAHQRQGWALLGMCQASTAQSPGIQQRVRLLMQSMEPSNQAQPSTPPAAPTAPPLPSTAPPRLYPQLPTPTPTPFPRHLPVSSLNQAPIQDPVYANLPPTIAPLPSLRPVIAPPPASMDIMSSLSSSSFSSDDDFLFDDLDYLELRGRQLNRRSSSLLVFTCPYCQEGGLDEMDLLDHCNANHRNDRRRVVCPICVALPHGDPTYHSRDFIGHINLRHCYYTEDFMDVTQNDAINQQAGILASYNSLVQHQ
ncbi:hypothetical protein JZ751_004098 [Albula glossodonta]|uniref:E3 ubiquitin-protein ligase RNF166 n=1 Tax=Albula glossodonta TaxID=121402 RepID=A0A8T2P3Q5_9TELE|nr:hypothetical protein JZ751_004098 [Albula glossodonta]